MHKKRPASNLMFALLIILGASPAWAASGEEARSLSVHLAALSGNIESIERKIVASESMLSVAERRLHRFEALFLAKRGITLSQLEHARSEYLRLLDRDTDLRKRLLQSQQEQLDVLDRILALQDTPDTLQTAGL